MARVTGFATPIPPHSVPNDAATRLRRLRGLAWFLDRSIPIGRYRIGLDPIFGLLPGAGDWLGAVLSLYIVYEGARLGLPASVLARMGGNILLEAIVGVIPLLGDLFDLAWQANTRNLALVERHYKPTRQGRPLRTFWFALLAIVALVMATVTGLIYLMLRFITAMF
jgi:hypothetical protein